MKSFPSTMKSSRPSSRGCGEGKFWGLGLEWTGEFLFDVISCCCNIGSMGTLVIGDNGDLTEGSCLTGAWSISINAGLTVDIGVGGVCAAAETLFRFKAFACAARNAAFDDRLANRASHGRPLSEQREHGTLLSQPVLACAQLRQAIGVRPATVGTPPGSGSAGSRSSWYVA